MRKGVERWTATFTVVVGVAMLAVALYARAGEALATQAAPAQRAAVPSPPVDFASQIKPIIEANCLECHSADKRKGGLSLAAYTDVLDGGRSGAVVRPGRAADSLLLARVRGEVGEQMPLDALPLSDAEIATFRQWIDQGARLTPSSPPAPAPWEAPLALTAPAVPAAVWAGWDRPADRLVAAYLSKAKVPEPRLIADTAFARRAYLDIWGLLPSRDEIQAFAGDPAPDKRRRLVDTLLERNHEYAQHWMSFWNDLLRNEYRGTGYIDGGRTQISGWLYDALAGNLPYDQFVTALVDPAPATVGFTKGIVWRGVVNASQTPEMQAAQNVAQVFMGVNLKCASCHDSFIDDWQLRDAYGMASVFATTTLEMVECDRPTGRTAPMKFLYDGIGSIDRDAARDAAPPRGDGPARRPDLHRGAEYVGGNGAGRRG